MAPPAAHQILEKGHYATSVRKKFNNSVKINYCTNRAFCNQSRRKVCAFKRSLPWCVLFSPRLATAAAAAMTSPITLRLEPISIVCIFWKPRNVKPFFKPTDRPPLTAKRHRTTTRSVTSSTPSPRDHGNSYPSADNCHSLQPNHFANHDDDHQREVVMVLLKPFTSSDTQVSCMVIIWDDMAKKTVPCVSVNPVSPSSSCNIEIIVARAARRTIAADQATGFPFSILTNDRWQLIHRIRQLCHNKRMAVDDGD